MSKDINSDFLNPKEMTLLAFEQFDGKPLMVPRKIKGAELRFPALDDKKRTIDLKLLESWRDFKGGKKNFWKYIIDFYNPPLKGEIPDIFKLLKIPRVLEELVLEYATMGYSIMDSSDNPQKVKTWTRIMGADDSWYFPWQNDNSLTQSLIEEEFYHPLTQKVISRLSAFLPHLPDILNFLPATIVNHISDYIDIAESAPKRSEVVEEIESFMEAYQAILLKADISGYGFLSEACLAISSIFSKSAFEPMQKNKLLGNRFPIKNPLDFLAVMVTQPVFPSHLNIPVTLFEHILNCFEWMDMNDIGRVPDFFKNVQALYESSYIIAMNKDTFTPPAKIVILPFEQIGHHFPITALQDEKGELHFPVLPAGHLQRDWSLQLMEGLRGYSKESRPVSLFNTIRPNSDILMQAFPWAVTGYNTNRDYDYPVHFPWVNDEKHQQLTHFLIEEEIYPSQTRKEIISKILLYFLPLPTVIVNIIDGYGYYVEKQPGKEWVINQVKAFIGKLRDCFKKAGSDYEYEYLMLEVALKALDAIHNNSGFEPFDPKVVGLIYKSRIRNQFPMKNAYDFLNRMLTQWPSGIGVVTWTLFEAVINVLRCMEPSMLRQVPEFFYMVKSLVESAYILSGNIPAHVGFHLTPDMEKSLYTHVDRRLQLGHHIKTLNNDGETPVLLMTILRLLNVKIMEENIKKYNDMNGFVIFLLDASAGVRLLNYHKRSKALDVVYNYINESKTSDSLFRHNEAKDLADRIVNTPDSASEYFLIHEIEQSPLFKNDESYAEVLHQVRYTLINDPGRIQSTASSQQEPSVQSSFTPK